MSAVRLAYPPNSAHVGPSAFARRVMTTVSSTLHFQQRKKWHRRQTELLKAATAAPIVRSNPVRDMYDSFPDTNIHKSM